jgi:hypothetical protein
MAHLFPTLMRCVLPRPGVAKEEIRSQFHRPLHSHISKQAPESNVSAFQNNQTRQHRMTNFVVSAPFNVSPNSLASLLVNKRSSKNIIVVPTHSCYFTLARLQYFLSISSSHSRFYPGMRCGGNLGFRNLN